jgi:L-xylulokinase
VPEARYLCLDCGLTATKAVLFDDRGARLAEAAADTPLKTAGRASEIDAETQWTLAAGLMRRALAAAGIRDGAVDGVGVSGFGGGLYALDSSGRPARAAITSMDTRAAGIVELWEREGRGRHDLTRHRPWAGQALPILAWMRAEEPESYRRVATVLGAKDWITYRLTGSLSTDRTDASNNALMDLAVGGYDPSILDAFGMAEAEAFLRPVRASHEVVGAVTTAAAEATGVASGTPVIAGMFDVVACALGSGALADDAYSLIAGTWNINSAFSRTLSEARRSTKLSLGPDEGRFAYVESSATSAGNLAWLLSSLEGLYPCAQGERDRDALYERINSGVAAVPPGAEGLSYLPFIHRSHLAPETDAAFVGMRAEHGVFHLLRALYEGVAFAHRAHLDLLAEAGIERPRAVLSGGAVSSDAWCRIFADTLGRRVETTQSSQAGALGIAAAIAAGTGRYPSLEEAASRMVRVRQSYEPDPKRTGAMVEAYERFKRAATALGTANPR